MLAKIKEKSCQFNSNIGTSLVGIFMIGLLIYGIFAGWDHDLDALAITIILILLAVQEIVIVVKLRRLSNTKNSIQRHRFYAILKAKVLCRNSD